MKWGSRGRVWENAVKEVGCKEVGCKVKMNGASGWYLGYGTLFALNVHGSNEK